MNATSLTRLAPLSLLCAATLSGCVAAPSDLDELEAAPDVGQSALSTSADTLTCAGYPEPRVFLESHAWFVRTPGKAGPDNGQLRAGTCFPWKQKLKGTVHLDVRYTMVDNPGTMTSGDIQIFGKSGGVVAGKISTKRSCASSVCTFWLAFDVDTTRAQHDGRQEFRVHGTVDEPNGDRMLVTTGWQAYLANGKPVADYRSTDDFIEGRGWYSEDGYTNARLDDTLPGILGAAPARGTWSPKVTIAPGSGGIPVTHSIAAVDPGFLLAEGDLGTVLHDAAGPYRGALTIDTTRLSNGTHHLVMRADAADAGEGSTNVGVIDLPFVVAN